MGIAKDAVQAFFGRRLNEKGQEVPDPTPIAMPLGYSHPPTLEQRIKTMIAVTLSRQAAAAGRETFEEANDFNVGDDDDVKFKDEDDDVAVNDPNVQKAFEEEVPLVREKISKAQAQSDALKASKTQKAKPKAAPAVEDGNDEENPE
jgi:hypothetical protein